METVAELKAQAQSAFLESNYEACISITSEAIGHLAQLASKSSVPTGPELSRLHSNRAAARLELGDYHAAADDAQKAIAFDGSWHRPYMRLCLALGYLGRREEAAEALQHGLRACSGNADQLQELRAALKDLEKQQLAVRQRHNAAKPSSTSAPVCAGSEAGVQQQQQQRALPVIALCGFLGAGKTTLVRHLLSSLQAQAEAPALQQQNQQQQQQPGDLPQVPPSRGQLPDFAAQEVQAGQAASCSFRGLRPLRIGLIVNDLAPLNVDAQLLALPLQPAEADTPGGPASLIGATLPSHLRDPGAGAAAALVELSNGCVCCNLKGDLQQALRRMAEYRGGNGGGHGVGYGGTGTGQASGTSADGNGAAAGGSSSSSRGVQGDGDGVGEGKLDVVIVESTGVGEPEALAAAVAALEPYGVVLHSVVTVVDAGSFLSYMMPYGGEQPAANRPGGGGAGLTAGRAGCLGSERAAGTGGSIDGGAGGDGRKPLAGLLAQQVECADLVLVNKCDLLLEQCVEEEQQRDQEAAAALGAAKEKGRGGGPQDRVGEGPSQGSGNKTAAASAAAAAEREARRRLGRVVAAVRVLNPTARVVPCCECRVAPEVVLHGVAGVLGEGGGALGAGRRDRRRAGATGPAGGTMEGSKDDIVLEQESLGAQLPGPPAAGEGGAGGGVGGDQGRAHEEEEYGIGSVVFETRQPFHPGRLWAVVQALVEQQGGRGLAEGLAARGGMQGLAGGSSAEAAAGGDGRRAGGYPGPLPAVPTHLLPLPQLLRAKGLFWVASLSQVRLTT